MGGGAAAARCFLRRCMNQPVPPSAVTSPVTAPMIARMLTCYLPVD